MLDQAVKAYLNRKNRIERPDGKFDRQGRWNPAEGEAQDCCVDIRTPSVCYPYSYLTHCCTLRHVAKLYGVEASELRAAVRKAEKELSK